MYAGSFQLSGSAALLAILSSPFQVNSGRCMISRSLIARSKSFLSHAKEMAIRIPAS
jgi:hypothetical protein